MRYENIFDRQRHNSLLLFNSTIISCDHFKQIIVPKIIFSIHPQFYRQLIFVCNAITLNHIEIWLDILALSTYYHYLHSQNCIKLRLRMESI